jgi:hypothetical protein
MPVSGPAMIAGASGTNYSDSFIVNYQTFEYGSSLFQVSNWQDGSRQISSTPLLAGCYP